MLHHLRKKCRLVPVLHFQAPGFMYSENRVAAKQVILNKHALSQGAFCNLVYNIIKH